MKKLTSLIFAILLIVLNIICTSCKLIIQPYKGNDPELYTMAINSVGTKGYISYGEVTESVEIVQIERDYYGRVLFAYYEGTINVYIFISQYADDTNVYYYQDYNFLGYCTESVNEQEEFVANIIADGTDINNLKEWNDWNKPINKEKCICSPIVRYSEYNHTNNIPLAIQTEMDKKFEKIRYCKLFARDKFGNQFMNIGSRENAYLCIVSATGQIIDSNFCFAYQKRYGPNGDVWRIINEPGYVYQESLKQLREQNYWNVRSIDDVINEMGSL